MEFSWDPRKQEINKKKHRISFYSARLVFIDPYVISSLDMRYARFGEERWYSIGLVANSVLYIAHTIGENDYGKETIHIISARNATLREQRVYFSHR
jgi:uncharacterized DUF497 family protein